MYLVIIKNNIEEKIKLNIRKDYQNSNLFASSDERKEITTNDDYELKTSEVPEKIKNEFKYDSDNNKYYSKIKNNNLEVEIEYYVILNSFIVKETKDGIQKEWDYNLLKKSLDNYNEFNNKNSTIIKAIGDFSDKDNNKEKQEIFSYFKNNYLDKYFK